MHVRIIETELDRIRSVMRFLLCSYSFITRFMVIKVDKKFFHKNHGHNKCMVFLIYFVADFRAKIY